ncbi:MAG: flagellar basal body P-ring formation chaperone FlgA [Bdellovibrionales bacterium]
MILGTFVCVGLMAILVYPQSAAAVSLRNHAVIDDNAIMLSDLFSGLPNGKDKVLGPAPRPGQDMTINARTLMRIAIALDLPWRPAHSGEYVVLTRAATVIDSTMIEDALQAEINESGVSGHYKLAFASALAEMILPMDQPANVEVQSLNLRQDQNRFEATLVAPSKADPVQTLRVSGAIHRMIKVPVLLDTARKGEVIRARDIEYIDLRETDLRGDMALDMDDLIGMTPRRIIFPGKTVRMSEIQPPVIVKRGDNVTMIFDDGGMRLTAKGKALENGAKGDLIRISNLSSSRNVEGVVTAQREVVIKTF